MKQYIQKNQDDKSSTRKYSKEAKQRQEDEYTRTNSSETNIDNENQLSSTDIR